MGYSENSPKRKIHSITDLPEETIKKKTQIDNLTLHLKVLVKTNKAQSE